MFIRKEIEASEVKNLSEFACLSKDSQGRENPEIEDNLRTCFMRDRDRILHSKAFRRLKHKTQVYISQDNDHYRTRLTHTLEVSQIARTIGRGLSLNEDLIEAIALGHDVGHTPFAHAGEKVLNELTESGFHHSENSVRVLKHIERTTSGRGLNLSQEVLEGILLHSGFGKKVKLAGTLEGQLVKLSDKIAYVQHDIDDSIRANILQLQDLPSEHLDVLGKKHGERISSLVNDAILATRKNLEKGIKEIALSDKYYQALKGLRTFMFKNVYNGKACSNERESAMFIVEYMFNYYKKNKSALPEFYREIAESEGLEIGVVDYISGMSDNFCIREFKKLAIPKAFI